MKNIEYINAGAGSGKTYTLTDKLATLIGEGRTTPSRVILTTFTKMAAEEFRVKARARLVEQGQPERAAEMDSATIGTVHAVALKYIQRYWYLLGLGAGVKAIPEEEEQSYIAATLYRVATDEDIAVFGKYAEAAGLRVSMSNRTDYDYWRRDIHELVNKAETFGVTDLDGSLKESLDLFEDVFQDEGEGETKTLRRDVVRRMFRIAAEWRSEYARYKRENNLVSYNDMETLFLQLLDHPQVRDDISQGVDYVFVDEFQDSNPTQVRIFDRLSELVAVKSFWVGDPKQAIYDFRGCDTRLTGAVMSLIEKRARDRESGFTFRTLDRSYRSDPALVELANKVFVPVFSRSLTEDKVRLDPERTDLLPADAPRIVHWSTVPGTTATGRPSFNKEVVAETLAVNVRNLVCGAGPVREVVDKDTGCLRPLRPSDIAVLCRGNAEVEALSSRLRTLGVPVSSALSADAGRAEMALLCCALNYMLGPSSLLEAEIAHLFDALSVESIVERPAGVKDSEVFRRLDRLRETLAGRPVPEVVGAVIDILDLEGFASRWGSVAERRSVLESARALAAGYETSSIDAGRAATLAGFVNLLSSQGVEVGQTAQRGGVNVMTYHKSKGLEWNVVVLSTLGDNPLDGKTFFPRNLFGVQVRRLSDPTPDNLYSRFILRYLPAIASIPETVRARLGVRPEVARIQADLLSEQARLLYVGVTRARDVLITISGKLDKMEWLKNLGITPAKDCATLDGKPGELWGAGRPRALIIQADRVPEGEDLPDAEPRMLSLAEESPVYDPRYLSPSKLASSGTTAVFSQVYPVGGPAERIAVGGGTAQWDVMGTCIHNILAACREDDEQGSVRTAVRTVSAYGLDQVLPDPAGIVRAAGNLYGFLREGWGEPVAVHHEMPFSYADGGRVVTGEMDLVWETPQGCVLVDFKNYPGYDDVLDESSAFWAGKYLPQMECYAGALRRAGRNVLAVLIFYAVQGRIIRVEL